MKITFVSECQNKALKRTRRVLDGFATRIGAKTWIAHITLDGLTSVRQELSKTATKNTAVAAFDFGKNTLNYYGLLEMQRLFQTKVFIQWLQLAGKAPVELSRQCHELLDF